MTSLFSTWLDAFFASYYRQRPVNATFIGMHEYDDRLPDVSRVGDDADALLDRLHALPDEPLSDAERVDRQLAEGFLLIQRWEQRSTHYGLSNPTLLTGEAVFGVLSLLLRPFAPLQERLDFATARLSAIPAFLETTLQPAPAAWIARARRECIGARLLFDDGLRALLAEAGIDHPLLLRAADAASVAFARFDTLLATLPPTEDYACGGEAFELLLRHAHLLDTNAEGLERLALERIAQEEEALATAPPPVASPDGDAPYLTRFETVWRAARELAEQRDLLSFPDWPVRFVEQPAWVRAAAPYLYFLPYRSPAPLDETPSVDYFVPPASDDSTIKLNHVVHHASLGHHVQNWFAARAASRIGRIAAVDCAARIAMLCGGTMAEGWANYATDLADEAGFLTPAEQRMQHRTRLRMAARAVVDIRLHQGRLSLADAADFYAQRAGMTAAAAHAEAVKNSLFPGAACMYLAGWDGIWQLRRAVQARHGSAFSLRTFHDRVLTCGSIPVSLVARHFPSGEGSLDVFDASSRVPAVGSNIR